MGDGEWISRYALSRRAFERCPFHPLLNPCFGRLYCCQLLQRETLWVVAPLGIGVGCGSPAPSFSTVTAAYQWTECRVYGRSIKTVDLHIVTSPNSVCNTRVCASRDGTPCPWELVEESIRATQPYDVFFLRSMLAVPYFEKVRCALRR